MPDAPSATTPSRSRLPTGSEHPWPDAAAAQGDLLLLEGEVALIGVLRNGDGEILRRRTLDGFSAPCLLPALPALPPSLALRFKVVRAATVQPLPPAGDSLPAGQAPQLTADAPPAPAGGSAPADQAPEQSAGLPPTPATNTAPADQAQEQAMAIPPPSGVTPPLQPTAELGDAEAADQPFPRARLPEPATLLAQLQPAPPPPQAAGSAADPCTTLVGWLAQRHGTCALPLAHPPLEPRERLRALLERAELIALPLRLEAKDLGRDCGDVILLGEAGPLLLLSEPRGYWLRDPAAPQRAPRRLRRTDLPRTGAPWPALGVSPSLPAAVADPVSLARFSYGPASQRALVLIGATGLGLAIGFGLAIGQEVGAARWIIGLGGVGALLGLGLALLSDPLRPALITALLSTLLGLLVPTFNTLLTNQALPDKDAGLMLQLAGLLLAAALADVGLRWSESSSLLSVEQKGAHRLQLASLERLLRLPPAFFQRYRAGELALRFGAISQVQQELQAVLSGGGLQALLSGVFLLFMLRISVQLTLLALVLALALVAPTLWIGRRSLRLERRREEQLAEAGSRNLELINSVSKLRLAGVEAAAAGYWWQPYREAIRSGTRVQARSAVAALLHTVLPNLGILLLFIVVTRLVADAALAPQQEVPNVGELLGFFSAFTTFIGAVVSSAGLMVQAFELPVLLERARPLLSATPETADPNRLDPGRLGGAVELAAVRFRYADSGPWVIDALDLQVRPGEFLAVVGPSGSGKSTLVRLLLGLEQPQEGEVRFDGRPLERLRIDLVRRQIGVVPQHAALLAGTIQEVIAGGAPISQELAWRAAEQAAIATDIQAMPMGLHTVVSEGGGNLSGGQRQRLAIARALARRPALLLLDEATSALDNRSQAEVGRHLRALGLTRIVIAHRLSTIRQADRSVVLEAGRIVQQGSFEQLLAVEGPFAALMARQRSARDRGAGERGGTGPGGDSPGGDSPGGEAPSRDAPGFDSPSLGGAGRGAGQRPETSEP
ncbi:MAG: ATP-binding cassette domain-containing protein [Synechococcaceae cyanobacterium]